MPIGLKNENHRRREGRRVFVYVCVSVCANVGECVRVNVHIEGWPQDQSRAMERPSTHLTCSALCDEQ